VNGHVDERDDTSVRGPGQLCGPPAAAPLVNVPGTDESERRDLILRLLPPPTSSCVSASCTVQCVAAEFLVYRSDFSLFYVREGASSIAPAQLDAHTVTPSL
jgi:hypothetical protein